MKQLEESIREAAAGRNVFFFVSGGVDSTVAYTLCLRALGPSRVHGVYVDTGLMREGETEFVERVFQRLAAGTLHRRTRRPKFLSALALVRDPEHKRHIIGEQFVGIQEGILQSGHYLDGQLDSRTGNYLSRYHRIRRYGQGGRHQDAP